MNDAPVVVLTALNLEYEAVRRLLRSPQRHRHTRGTQFEVGTLPHGDGRVALGLTGKGNHSAAVLAERAIQAFSPSAVVFVGVAGALWETPPLGDVVVATHVYAYHGGTSEDDGLKARPRAWEAPHEIAQLAAHVTRVGDWTDDAPTTRPVPRAHLGAIAAGEIVQNSRISHEAQWIRQTYNDAAAIEMEAAGIAQAGHLSGSAVAIVRGISDRADGSKSSDADRNWQPIAAENAAAFALRLAQELTDAQEETTVDKNTPSGKSGNVTNTAYGNVGVQAGHVHNSSFHVSQPPSGPKTDVVAELHALREELAQERSAGRIDEDTHEAASEELDIASKGIEEGTPDGKKSSVLALKRLRGLLSDLASFAAKIAPLISAVRGNS